MVIDIKKQLSTVADGVIRSIQDRFTIGEIVPYEYQALAYIEIGKRIARYKDPFFVKASVSAGKTIMIAMVAARCQQMGLPMMVLARQAEIVAQDSEEISNFGVPNSVYCAGLNTKSAYFPIVVGSEKTVCNGLFKSLADYAPQVLAIDECHQVDWVDIAESIDNNESFLQMVTPKGEKVKNPDRQDGECEYLLDDNGLVMMGTGRSQYTIIIRELQQRCRTVHNKELRIFGLTGSEFRGVTPILVEDKHQLGFWREQVTNIDTNYLIEFGSVVPTIFGGEGGVKYDLDEFQASDQDGTADFDSKVMRKMEEKIHKSLSLTQQIMQMVAREAEHRNAVLITCAGQRHCKEAAEALPPGSTYAIITEKTSAKQRKQILDDVRAGKIKYTFQVMALTTGVNVPNWDFSVILRKIGSLTLLIQLLGRGMRKLKSWQVKAGMVKNNHLVWDFAGCLDELGSLYFDPVLEQAQYQRRNESGKLTKICPICGAENSFYARRCINETIDPLRVSSAKISCVRRYHRLKLSKTRCEYFWKSRRCEDQYDPKTKKLIVRGCGAENDVAAKICRVCDVTLIDPNEKLSGKHYTKNDYCAVNSMSVEISKNQKAVFFRYSLTDKIGNEFTAWEKFFPESSEAFCKAAWRKAALAHIPDRQIAAKVGSLRNAIKIMEYSGYFLAPVKVTHRRNNKGDDIIAYKDFS